MDTQRESSLQEQVDVLRDQLLTVLIQLSELQDKTARARLPGVMPDPEIFNNGESLDYDIWSFKMEAKLRRDHLIFPSAREKMDYIFSRTSGQASRVLLPRMKDGKFKAANPEDLFKALNDQFGDQFRKDKARKAFRCLRLNEGDDYLSFFRQFTLLALEAEIDLSRYKAELANKLPMGLASAFADDARDDSVSFDKYQAKVAREQAAK